MAKDEGKKEDLREEVELEDSEELEDQLETLRAELDKREADYTELTDSFLRLQADFTNYKNRTEQEKSNIIKSASEEVMNGLLPVLDNFERALENIEKDTSIYEGVELIYTQLIDKLKASGLEEIVAEGQEFDPNYHHAVLMEESDKYEKGYVLEVLQKGYTLNGKVIRPSMVKVIE